MEIKNRYAYILVITNNEGLITAYDYFITRKATLNSSAVYNDLSGVDLWCFNLEDIDEYENYVDRLDDICESNAKRIKVLLDLNKSIKEFLEALI